MSSVWIKTRRTAAGGVRHRVEYRPGGRESPVLYGGSFKTKREAVACKTWIAGELAAQRMPDLRLLADTRPAPTVTQAADRWRQSRVDVAESTRVLHRVALKRVTDLIGTRRVDELVAADVADLVGKLAERGSKRETIRKSVTYLGMVLDHEGLTGDRNPARDRITVRLPREERAEINPPTAQHVAAVYWLLAPAYRLPLVWLDWSGARVASVEHVRVGDYDEPRRRVRLRQATTKTRQALWIDLPDDLAEAIEQTLPPLEDRDPEAPLFQNVTADRLRTAIARACKLAGVPTFSPHDLRHRRISLLHRQGRTWAEIGRLVGQRKLSVTADTYTHVLSDGAELDLAQLLAGR